MTSPKPTRLDRLFSFWQLISKSWQLMVPWMKTKGSCRFRPTCSRFALQAIGRYGMILGVWMSLKRIRKCHPFSQGGSDPIENYL